MANLQAGLTKPMWSLILLKMPVNNTCGDIYFDVDLGCIVWIRIGNLLRYRHFYHFDLFQHVEMNKVLKNDTFTSVCFRKSSDSEDNNRITKTKCETWPKLTINTSDWNYVHQFNLIYLLLSFSRFQTLL